MFFLISIIFNIDAAVSSTDLLVTSMIGQLLDSDVNDRLIGSVTMAVLAAQRVQAIGGSVILRVHDVKETVQALTILRRVKKSEGNR